MRPILEGIRVLDVGSFVFAPAAATVMADFGADVIKVEPPKTGDPYRLLYRVPPLPACDEDYCWLLTSRGKRGIALDLKAPEGLEILLRLIRSADVFVTNYPTHVLESLRLAWSDLQPQNDRLVYAHASGFGEHGPEAEKPGYDLTAWWARSGLQHAVRTKGSVPALSVPGMGDHPSAMTLFGAIMLALYQRERTGRGARVQSSLLANGLWSNAIYAQAILCGAPEYHHIDCHAPENALMNQYETKDGEWLLLVLVQEDKLWPALCRAIERRDLESDPRFATRDARRSHAVELCQILEPLFASRELAHWRTALDREQVTFGHVARIAELASDPQVAATGLLHETSDSQGRPVRTIACPISIDDSAPVAYRPAPRVGEHTDEVLAAAGYDEATRTALRARGVIR